jgi:branched-chain amino acid transport system substrate-binding protein
LAILFSTSGPYAALGREALDGALMALAEVNAAPRQGFTLVAEICDPAGQTENYAPLLDQALRRTGARHAVGGITSWSRKEMIPTVERHQALLWYGCPYEGFEANDRVIYLGACPNQHIVPLFAHALPRYGARGCFVGSNYIWGWETNRIGRELVTDHGGCVASERYLPLGDTNVQRVIDEIAAKRPDFILNTLIGPSSYAFFAAYARLAAADPAFAAARRPVLSCNLTECELGEIGPAAIGHLSTAPYFDSLPEPANAAFRRRLAARFGKDRKGSAFFLGAWLGVHLLAEAMREAGTDNPDTVLRVVTSRRFATPLGPLGIDPRTNHAILRPHLARVAEGGSFEIIESAAEPIAPDPYLAEYVAAPPAATARSGQRPNLRVVR